jgi:hypothetical protein
MSSQIIDICAQFVPGHGFIPKLRIDGSEKYRGEFQKTPEEAVLKARMQLQKFVLSGEVVIDDPVGS